MSRGREARTGRRAHQPCQITRYRCRDYQMVYTLYTGTLFARKQLRPAEVILLLRGVCKGESTANMPRELSLAYDTVHHLRQQCKDLRAAVIATPNSLAPHRESD